MLERVILWRLDVAERDLGESVDYLRRIARASTATFLRFTKALALAKPGRAAPLAAQHVARLVATCDEDCGTCLRIEVRLARRAGVDADVLRAVLDRAPERLPPDLAAVYRFTESVVLARYDEEPQRAAIVAAYGEAGLADLALAIAGCRVFPVVKRAMGFATSCRDVRVEV